MALGVIALSVSNTLLFLPPAAPEPGRLVTIYSWAADSAIDQISYPDFEYFRANNHVFEDIAAAPNSIGLLVDRDFEGREIKLSSRPVSHNYFAVLRVQPFLGRFFEPADDRVNSHVAVMTYSCWKRMGADPKIVGKVLGGNTIVGVTPKSFTGSFYGLNGDLLLPLSQADNPASFEKRDTRRLFLTARLKPGVSRRQAQTEMAGLSRQLAVAYPKDDGGRAAVVARASLLPPDMLVTAEWISAVLLALVLRELLIACANVANLMLAAAVGRRQEAAIKLALGAPRGRLVRDFLAESALICAAGGALGFGFAAFVLGRYSYFSFFFPSLGSFAVGLNLHLDATVAALTVGLIAIATLATGVAPALYASSPRLAQLLAGEIAGGGESRNFRRNALVVVQVAVCTLVLVGMGLCQRNLYNLRHADLGFSARRLVAAPVYLQAEGYSEPQGKAFYERLRTAVSSLAGVESVTLAWDLPLFGGAEVAAKVPGAAKSITAGRTGIDTAYLSTFGIRLLAGRNFDSRDREGAPLAAIVNHKLAGMFWPGEDPVGKVLLAGDPERRFTVVGVAADAKYEDFDEPPRPFVYFALSQNYSPAIHVIARTAGDPKAWVAPLGQTLRGLGLQSVMTAATLESWMNLTLLPQRMAAGCVGVLSLLGLALAVSGLFGAISHSVSERKKELGIRVALGAAPWRLARMILAETAAIAGIGIGAGLLLGVAATILFRSQFYGIGAVEWTVLVPVAAAMLAVSLAIAYVSARSWLAIDPMDAIRHA
jgi:putative ABC transport system permease protein